MSKNIEMNYKIDSGYEVIYPSVQIYNVNNLQNNLNNLQSQINGKLPLSGGTMRGNLILNGNPSSNNQAANKGYVDDQIDNKVSSGINSWALMNNGLRKVGTKSATLLSNAVVSFPQPFSYYDIIYFSFNVNISEGDSIVIDFDKSQNRLDLVDGPFSGEIDVIVSINYYDYNNPKKIRLSSIGITGYMPFSCSVISEDNKEFEITGLYQGTATMKATMFKFNI